MSDQPRRSQRNGADISSARHGATKGMFSGDWVDSETGKVDMQFPPLGMMELDYLIVFLRLSDMMMFIVRMLKKEKLQPMSV